MIFIFLKRKLPLFYIVKYYDSNKLINKIHVDIYFCERAFNLLFNSLDNLITFLVKF